MKQWEVQRKTKVVKKIGENIWLGENGKETDKNGFFIEVKHKWVEVKGVTEQQRAAAHKRINEVSFWIEKGYTNRSKMTLVEKQTLLKAEIAALLDFIKPDT